MSRTSELITGIYESIGDPGALEHVVRQIITYTHSRSSQFGFLDRSGRWVNAAVVGVDLAALQEYPKYHVANDPRSRFSFEHVGDFHSCSEMIQDRTSFERTDLADYLDRVDGRYMLGAYFPVGPLHLGGLGLFRARKDGVYDDHDVQKAQRLLSHLRRAMGLHVRLGRLECQLGSLEALVDRLASPVFLVDQAQVLRYANHAGLLELQQGKYLMLRDGRIEPRCLRQDQQLADTIAATFIEKFSAKVVSQGGTMRLLDEDEHSAVLTVYSLHGAPGLQGMPQAKAILFLTYPHGDTPTEPAPLQVLLGLTPAEAQLASLLSQGESLATISRSLRLGRETLKSQLDALFSKTGTHRQGELVALLRASVTVPLR